MKKELSFVLLAVVVFGRCGCVGGQSEETSPSESEAVPSLPVAKQVSGPFWEEQEVQDPKTGKWQKGVVYDMFIEKNLICRLECAEISWRTEKGYENKAVVAGYDKLSETNNSIEFTFKSIDPFKIGGDTYQLGYRVTRFILLAGYDFCYYRYGKNIQGVINDETVYDYKEKKAGDQFFYSFVS